MLLILLVSGAMLLLPHGDELLLALLAPLEVLGIVGLLQRVPVVEDPVRGGDYSLVGYTAHACWDWRKKRLRLITLCSIF